jgi:hypothetical protein
MIFPKYLAEPLPSARGTPRFRGTPIKKHWFRGAIEEM